MNAKFAILLTKITVAQNEVAINYHAVRGLFILAFIFAATIGVFHKWYSISQSSQIVKFNETPSIVQI